MVTSTKQAKRHSGLMLFLLTIIFVGPMAFAWVMYFKAEAFNIKSNPNGVLISPAVYVSTLKLSDTTNQPFVTDTLKGKWWLVYLSPDQCFDACHEILYNMRQIQTALGKESHRVERMILAPAEHANATLDQFITNHYPDIQQARLQHEIYDTQFAPLGDPKDRAALGELVVIDPKGQVVIYYDGDTPPKGILTDLKRLLKISQIG